MSQANQRLSCSRQRAGGCLALAANAARTHTRGLGCHQREAEAQHCCRRRRNDPQSRATAWAMRLPASGAARARPVRARAFSPRCSPPAAPAPPLPLCAPASFPGAPRSLRSRALLLAPSPLPPLPLLPSRLLLPSLSPPSPFPSFPFLPPPPSSPPPRSRPNPPSAMRGDGTVQGGNVISPPLHHKESPFFAADRGAYWRQLRGWARWCKSTQANPMLHGYYLTRRTTCARLCSTRTRLCRRRKPSRSPCSAYRFLRCRSLAGRDRSMPVTPASYILSSAPKRWPLTLRPCAPGPRRCRHGRRQRSV